MFCETSESGCSSDSVPPVSFEYSELVFACKCVKPGDDSEQYKATSSVQVSKAASSYEYFAEPQSDQSGGANLSDRRVHERRSGGGGYPPLLEVASTCLVAVVTGLMVAQVRAG